MANLDLIDGQELSKNLIELNVKEFSSTMPIKLGQSVFLASNDILESSFENLKCSNSFLPSAQVDYIAKKSEYIIKSINGDYISMELLKTYSDSILKPITLIIGFIRPRIIRKIFELSSVLPIREILIYKSDLSDPSYLLSSEYSEYLIKERQKYSVKQSGIAYLPKVKLFEDCASFISSIIIKLPSCRILGDSRSSLTFVDSYKSGSLNKDEILNQGFSLFVGPERGFSKKEYEIFKFSNIIPITNGQETYQVDAAVISMCSNLKMLYQLMQ